MAQPSDQAVASEKKRFRRTMRTRRASINPTERQISGERMRRLCLELPELADARSVFAYVSFGSEMPTRTLIEALLARGVALGVPVIEDKGVMTPARLTDLSELRPGRFGIPTPRDPQPLPDRLDAILAPCIAVTPEGKRLGVGGGYYDRFLADHDDVFVAALAFEAQVTDWLPTEPHDRSVDAIVTEQRVIRCG
ncbi:MAG: 5-formyltetrahydrofolate cyclo-ligase [Phycisphaeraceae bacterium]